MGLKKYERHLSMVPKAVSEGERGEDNSSKCHINGREGEREEANEASVAWTWWLQALTEVEHYV